MGFLGVSVVKNLPAMQEMGVQSLDQEDLEKEMVTCSNIAWRIPRTEEPGDYSPWGRKRVGYDLATKQQNNSII